MNGDSFNNNSPLDNSVPTPLRNIQRRKWYENQTADRRYPPSKPEPHGRKRTHGEKTPYASTSSPANKKRCPPQEWRSQQYENKLVSKQQQTSARIRFCIEKESADRKCDDSCAKKNSGSRSTKEFQEGRYRAAGYGFHHGVASSSSKQENEIALHSREESKAHRVWSGINSQREGKETLWTERSKSENPSTSKDWNGKRTWKGERHLNSQQAKIFALKRHGKDDCETNDNSSNSDSTSSSSSDDSDNNDAVSKNIPGTPSKKMRVTVAGHKNLQDFELNSVEATKSQPTEEIQPNTSDSKAVSTSQQKRAKDEENRRSCSGTTSETKEKLFTSPCKKVSGKEKHRTDSDTPVNIEKKEDGSTSQHKNASKKTSPDRPPPKRKETLSTSRRKKASCEEKPCANSGPLVEKKKRKTSTSQCARARSGKDKKCTESGTPVNKEDKKQFTSQCKKAKGKEKHRSDPHEKLTSIAHNEAWCGEAGEAHPEANRVTLEDDISECNKAVETILPLSKSDGAVVLSSISTTEIILDTSKTEEGSLIVTREEKASDKGSLQDDINFVNSFPEEALVLNNQQKNHAQDFHHIKSLNPQMIIQGLRKHLSHVHMTSPENTGIVLGRKILPAPCTSLQPLACHSQVLQQQQQLDQHLTTEQQGQKLLPVALSLSPQQSEEFFNPHERQDVPLASAASQQFVAVHDPVQQQEHQHPSLSTQQSHGLLNLQQLQYVLPSQQLLAAHHQVRQQHHSLKEHQGHPPFPVLLSLPHQPEEFLTPQELQPQAPQQPGTHMSEQHFTPIATQQATAADSLEDFIADSAWALAEGQSFVSLETQRFSQTLLTIVRGMIRCSSCKTTFNRSVICQNYVIQLNRPIQCPCSCVICKSCYSEQKGCSVHNVSSDRCVVNTTANTLASCSDLETMEEWDLLRDPEDPFRTEKDSNQYVQQILRKEQAPNIEELRAAFGLLIQNKDTVSFRYWENEQMLDEVAFRYVCIPHVPGFWDHVLVGTCPLPETEKMIGPDHYLPKLFNVSLPNSYKFHWCCFVLKKQIILAMWCTAVCASGKTKVMPLVDCVLRKHVVCIEFRRMVFYLSRWFTAQYVSPINRELKVVLDSMPSEGPSLVHLIASLAHKSGMDCLIPQVYQIRPCVDLNYNFNLNSANYMFTCPREDGANGDYVNITDEFNSYHDDSSACMGLTRVYTTTESYRYL